MKVFVYSYREFDEAEWFTHFSNEYGIELGTSPDAPTLENASLAKGYEYISIIPAKIDALLVQRFHDLSVRMYCSFLCILVIQDKHGGQYQHESHYVYGLEGSSKEKGCQHRCSHRLYAG